MNNHVYTFGEAALAYALCAEKICDGNVDFLNRNPGTIPIFVSMLFQSLEISIKHAGIESGLFTIQEARTQKKGHGIAELAQLAVEKLGGDDPRSSLIPALTIKIDGACQPGTVIGEMICGRAFEKTRQSYLSRRLGYAEIANGDFALFSSIRNWIESVKQTALNLDTTIDILKQWKNSTNSTTNPKVFAIWFSENK